MGLASQIKDEDIYGPPVRKRAQRPLHPAISTVVPLVSWRDGVPETIVHGLNGGWAVMDNVIVLNGTVFIVANDASKFPPVYRMFSSGVEMSNDPATFAGREATSRDIRIVSQREAAELFGPQGSRIEGVSFLCNDDKQFVSHYYHYTAEILFGLWRAYSSLDLNIPPTGVSKTLTAPRRFILPHVHHANFVDYSGLSEYITRAVFPSLGFEFRETWADRNETQRPFVLERVVIGDRIAAEQSAEWHGLYKYAAPAFKLPGSGPNFWSPVRRALVLFLGLDELLPPPDVGGISTSGKGVREGQKTVITYVSRQGWGRRTLKDSDHKALVKALKALERRYGYEVNIVRMEKLSRREQLSLAVRTTIMMGVHGNGLTHSLWMDPSRRPLLLEFFAEERFSYDYEYPMRELGISYYACWGKRYFSHQELPQPHIDDEFHSTAIRIDAASIATLIHAHVSGSALP